METKTAQSLPMPLPRELDRYIYAIRNKRKRDYARVCAAWELNWSGAPNPNTWHNGLGAMARGIVAMRVSSLATGGGHEQTIQQ